MFMLKEVFANMDKQSLARIIVFLMAWFNQYLVSQGKQPLPLVDEESVANTLTFIVSVWTLMKTNQVKKPVRNRRKKPQG